MKKVLKMSMDKYIKERYQDQVDWYDKKAQKNKLWANIFQITIIVLAAITPILAALDKIMFTIITSSVVAIVSGLLKYLKIEDHWHNYRTICETLRKEKHYHDFKIGEYEQAEDIDKLFVNRVESIISKENTTWLTSIKKKERK